MRVAVFERIMRQSMGWFDFPEHSTGELTTRLEEDSEAVANVTGIQLGTRIQITSSLVAGIAISLAFSWQIGLISLACMPFIVGAGMLQARCSKPPHIEGEGTLSAPTILERGFHDIFVLQAYNLQDVTSDQYSRALKPDAEYKVKQGIYTGLVYGFTQVSAALASDRFIYLILCPCSSHLTLSCSVISSPFSPHFLFFSIRVYNS